VNLTCIHNHLQIVEIFSFFLWKMNIRYRGTHWCRWSLFSSNQWLQPILILVVLCNCDFKNFFVIISQTFILFSSITLVAAQNHTHKTIIRHKLNQIWFLPCRYFFPMPQLTTDCDRVVVIYIPPSDVMDFNVLHMMRLVQMMMEIKISEDYCRSDIYVADYGNLTMRLISKITPSILKKFELCSFVSYTYIFCVYKDSRA